MRPAISIHDGTNSRIPNTELLSHGRLLCSSGNKSADLKYLFSGQFRHTVALALSSASLRFRIVHICRVVALKQMRWIAARTAITLVANMHRRPTACGEEKRQ